MSDSVNVESATERLGVLLTRCEDLLCEEAVKEVVHYVENAEPEMAFEGLFMELMQIGSIPERVDKSECAALGRALNLENESVLDDDFWEKFIEFIS